MLSQYEQRRGLSGGYSIRRDSSGKRTLSTGSKKKGTYQETELKQSESTSEAISRLQEIKQNGASVSQPSYSEATTQEPQIPTQKTQIAQAQQSGRMSSGQIALIQAAEQQRKVEKARKSEMTETSYDRYLQKSSDIVAKNDILMQDYIEGSPYKYLQTSDDESKIKQLGKYTAAGLLSITPIGWPLAGIALGSTARKVAVYYGAKTLGSEQQKKAASEYIPLMRESVKQELSPVINGEFNQKGTANIITAATLALIPAYIKANQVKYGPSTTGKPVKGSTIDYEAKSNSGTVSTISKNPKYSPTNTETTISYTEQKAGLYNKLTKKGIETSVFTDKSGTTYKTQTISAKETFKTIIPENSQVGIKQRFVNGKIVSEVLVKTEPSTSSTVMYGVGKESSSVLVDYNTLPNVKNVLTEKTSRGYISTYMADENSQILPQIRGIITSKSKVAQQSISGPQVRTTISPEGFNIKEVPSILVNNKPRIDIETIKTKNFLSDIGYTTEIINEPKVATTFNVETTTAGKLQYYPGRGKIGAFSNKIKNLLTRSKKAPIQAIKEKSVISPDYTAESFSNIEVKTTPTAQQTKTTTPQNQILKTEPQTYSIAQLPKVIIDVAQPNKINFFQTQDQKPTQSILFKVDSATKPNVFTENENRGKYIEISRPDITIKDDFLSSTKSFISAKQQPEYKTFLKPKTSPEYKQQQTPEIKQDQETEPEIQYKEKEEVINGKTPIIPTRSLGNPKEKIPPEIPINTRFMLDYDRSRRIQSGFTVFSRIRGRWVRISDKVYDEKSAISYGADYVGKRAAASFRIQKVNSPITGKFMGMFRKSDFYQKDEVFIEKRNRRIKSQGEIKEISYKGVRSKKRKSMFKNMFRR